MKYSMVYCETPEIQELLITTYMAYFFGIISCVCILGKTGILGCSAGQGHLFSSPKVQRRKKHQNRKKVPRKVPFWLENLEKK